MKKRLIYLALGIVIILGIIGGFCALFYNGSGSENLDNSANSGALKRDYTEVLVPDGAPLLSIAAAANGNDQIIENGVLTVNNSSLNDFDKLTKVKKVDGPDQLVATIKTDKPEFAIVPLNLAQNLYENDNADGKTQYKLAGVTSWGLNVIVGNAEITSFNDLVGKKLYTFGKNETPGIVLRRLIGDQNVKFYESDNPELLGDDAVNLVELATASDAAVALAKDNAEGIASFGMLPEPVASTFKAKTDGKFDIRLDLQEIWKDEHNGISYPQSGLVVRTDFLSDTKNRDYLSLLLKMMATWSDFAQSNPENAVNLAKTSFQSTMFSTPEPAVEAIKSGRLNVKFAPVYERSDDSHEISIAVTDYLQLIGNVAPDDGFWAELP